jgi:hypothetical protein
MLSFCEQRMDQIYLALRSQFLSKHLCLQMSGKLCNDHEADFHQLLTLTLSDSAQGPRIYKVSVVKVKIISEMADLNYLVKNIGTARNDST